MAMSAIKSMSTDSIQHSHERGNIKTWHHLYGCFSRGKCYNGSYSTGQVSQTQMKVPWGNSTVPFYNYVNDTGYEYWLYSHK